MLWTENLSLACFPFSLSERNACRENSEFVEEFKKAYGGGVKGRTSGKQKEAKIVKGGR